MIELPTICSIVYNDQRTGLFDFMVKSILKNSPYAPNFVICDNGGNDLNKYRKMTNFKIIDGASKNRGSLQHGESLNNILSLVRTQKVAIIESDCVVLSPNWYKFDKDTLAAVKGEFAGKFYYHMCFLISNTKDLVDTDFRPGKDKPTNRSYKAYEDVGWRFKKSPKQIDKMTFIDCKTGKGKIFDHTFQSDEFWFKDEPLLAHFGRGSNISGKAIRKGFEHPKQQLELWKEKIKVVLDDRY